jgi:YVTN family beta-propeller protein
VIDGSSNTVATFAAGPSPSGVAVNPVTDRVYLTELNGNSVAVFDGGSNTVIATVPTGANCLAVAVNPVSNKIYVTNANSNSVTVIDGATNTPATVTAGAAPEAVAVNAVANRMYVANSSDNTITVIDGATNTTTVLTAGTTPRAVAVNPVTNKIYVANFGSANVTVIDGATNTTAAVATGSGPLRPAVNPATNKIYVANSQSADVTVIDGATNTTTTLGAGTFPWAAGVNPVTNKIYVANQGSNNVTVIDGATNTTGTVAVGTAPVSVAVNPVTNKIYVVNGGSNNVSVIDGATNTIGTVAAGTTPISVAVNPVTNKIYVVNSGSSDATVIDGATNTTATIAAGTGPNAVAVNSVTNKIYVVNLNSGNVTVIDGATNTSVTVATGNSPFDVAVNPVTNKIYVANQSSNNVTVIDGATNATSTVPVGNIPYLLVVNPVTNKIYVGRNDGSGIVTVIDGATNTTSTAVVSAGFSASATLAVNPITNTIYVPNLSNQVAVLTEQQVQQIPLVTAIAPLTGNQTTSPTPTFDFTATSSYSPTAPPPQAVYFQVDTWQGPWTIATGANPNFTGQTGALSLGSHILYAFAGDGQEAGIVGDGLNGQVTIGAIAAYQFTVVQAATTTILSSNLNPANVGQTVTLTATVAVVAPGTGTPTGSVIFLDGSTSLGTVTLGANLRATLNISTLTAGTHSLTAQYSGDANFLASTSSVLTQTVNGVLAISPPTLPSGTVGTAYSQTVQVTGGTAPYGWAVSGSLPPGLAPSLGPGSTIGISGTPTTAGSFPISVRVNDANGLVATQAYTIVIADVAPAITTQPASQTINSRQAATMTVAASGTELTYQWYQGSSGVTTNPISGATASSYTTPALTATTSYWVHVTNSAGHADSATATITVGLPPTVLTTTLPGGIIGTAYTSTTLQASGGKGPYTWTAASGSVAPGLTLSSDGGIAGTPTVAGTFDLTLLVTDSTGLSATSGPLSIAVVAPPNAPTCLPPTVQTSGTDPLTVTAMSNCNDSQSSITSTTIDWGDGTPPSSGSSAQHPYTSAGSYTIRVTATNANGLSNTGSGNATVTAPLTASVPQGQSAQETTNVIAPLGVPSVQVTYQCVSAVGPGGVSQPLSTFHLSCNINSQGSTATVVLTSTPTPVTVKVQTNSGAALQSGWQRGNIGGPYSAFLWIPGIVVVGMGWGQQRRKRKRGYVGLVLLGLTMWSFAACGGGSMSSQPPPQNITPAGTYGVNVNGTSTDGSGTTVITVGFTVTIG